MSLGKIVRDSMLDCYRWLGGIPFSFKDFCGLIDEEYFGEKSYGLAHDVDLSRVSFGVRDFLRSRAWFTRLSLVRSNQFLIADCSTGWVLDKRLRICIQFNRSQYDQCGADRVIKPNIFRLMLNSLRRGRFLSSAIFLPYGNANYFHFWNDFLGGMVALGEAGVKCPVLINASLYESKFFRQIFSRSEFLRSFEYIPYTAADVFFVRNMYSANMHWGSLEGFRKTWESVLGAVEVPRTRVKSESKTFVSRKSGTARPLKNLAAIEGYLSSLGFEVVYFEDMSVFEQVRVVDRSKVICFLHGAGMTNLAFSSCGVSNKLIVEVTSESYINPVFGYMCNEIGCDWVLVTGSKFDADGFFELDQKSLAFLEGS